ARVPRRRSRTRPETQAMKHDEAQTDLERQRAPLPAGETVTVRGTELPEIQGDAPEGAMGIGVLMDMPVRVTVEVGRVSVSLGELCRLGPGSLLQLDREAHQPADILVNGKVVARGEIVTI